ncbi:hypothetical protein EVA_04163 [gut metagenome]|uniref:Uncharacterized protein n=1 Tax=gut metagenome TaxID=749906 RepID=J9GK88_9ZZZZ
MQLQNSCSCAHPHAYLPIVPRINTYLRYGQHPFLFR